jgi:DNA mismatch repair protein MutS2
MDKKTLTTLEYPKVLERLRAYAAFNASQELIDGLRPTSDLDEARGRLAETSEARALLAASPGTTIGGARDIRDTAEAAARGIVLTPPDFLDIKSTLVSARTMRRTFEDAENTYPNLFALAAQLPGELGLVDAITKTISERGQVLDSASEKLANIRRDLTVVHDRLLDKMNKLVNSKSIAPHLQEAIVTQRDGRYVLPIKAEARARVKSVVHDKSSSGATLFVEPLGVVDLNNQWRELQLAERDEERRILAELSAAIGEQKEALFLTVEILTKLDLAFACAKYAVDLRAVEPVLVEFKPVKKHAPHPGVTLKLWQARHPLLDQETVVPIDVELHPENYVLVITGPNTGGKTVTLKTVGLLALMAQSGLHVPAQSGSEISLFKDIYADIGDEQSIEQSLSTFSGHVTNIIRILERAGQGSLVIVDELGAGTDPQEGAALARAILHYLVERGVTTLVATHYPELKTYAHATKGVVNASVEFDLETLRPTYHLTIGLPGRSNALHIAQRLGLQEEVVEAARGTIDPSELKADDLLEEIRRQRDVAQQAREQAEKAAKEAGEIRKELAERLEGIEDERIQILDEARAESQAEVEALRKEVEKAHRALSRARQPLEKIKKVEEQVSELQAEVQEPAERQQVPESLPDRPLRLGDRVRVRTLDQSGIVSALAEEEVEVQIGMLRVRARLGELEWLAHEAEREPDVERAGNGGAPLRVASPGGELSLRGLRVDEALDRLDRYIDNAFLAGLPYVRIIHGKGTGKLREAVRKELASHPEVERYETAQPNEGGDGVTVAFFNH